MDSHNKPTIADRKVLQDKDLPATEIVAEKLTKELPKTRSSIPPASGNYFFFCPENNIDRVNLKKDYTPRQIKTS